MDALPKGQSEHFISDLRGMDPNTRAMFFLPKKKGNHSGVMRGQFTYHHHFGGLSIHGGRVTELQDISNCFELPAGLSFNFLFEGCIDFALAGKKYRMGGLLKPQLPICTSIILSRPEILTKYMSRGMHIYKLNLFVERSWLESRCDSRDDFLQLSRLFQRHASVANWVPKDKMVTQAKSLLVSQDGNQLVDKIQSESCVVELLSQCLKGLGEFLDSSDEKQMTQRSNKTAYPLQVKGRRLKEAVDRCLEDCHSLEAIAVALNMSVSTLQRRFKAAFGVTVIDYVRRRRLEIARNAMLHSGLSVGEAAYLAGYKYPSNFVTAFKKQFNHTPSEFIRAHI